MRSRRTAWAAVVALGVAALLPLSLRAHAASWIVREGDVRIVCPLSIGGSFEARTKKLSGSVSPGSAPTDPWLGEFVVELSGLDTGIDLRTEHMRNEYLEVNKGPDFARAVLSGIRLVGVAADQPAGKGTFSATLRLHGVERPVMGQVELRRSGQGLRARASFPLVLEDFKIAKPRYLGVGVTDEVTVQVSFETTSAENAR